VDVADAAGFEFFDERAPDGAGFRDTVNEGFGHVDLGTGSTATLGTRD
jgi:hypothetical protein